MGSLSLQRLSGEPSISGRWEDSVDGARVSIHGGFLRSKIDRLSLSSPLRADLFCGLGYTTRVKVSGGGRLLVCALKRDVQASKPSKQLLKHEGALDNWRTTAISRNVQEYVSASPAPGGLDLAIRVLYGLALYGAMASVGWLVCNLSGVDPMGGFQLDAASLSNGILCSLPPTFITLVLHQDYVAEKWEPARAMRESEDEEIRGFFFGMSKWQCLLVAAASSVCEQFFFRSALQGGLSHAMAASGKGITDTTQGMASLTGFIPTFAPCTQTCAAVLTAAITASLFYLLSSTAESGYIVADFDESKDIRKQLGDWHNHEQMKRIYSPLFEGLLSLYLGMEWITTGNLLCPILTHCIYYMINLRLGLQRAERATSLTTQKRGSLRE